MHDLLPYLPALLFTAASVTTSVCVTIVRLRPYREARRFGDAAVRAAGKKKRASIALSLARDHSRRRDRAVRRKKKRHAG